MFSQLDPTLALVLLYDFLLGKGICCGGPLKKMIHKHKTILMETSSKISSKEISVAAVSPGISILTVLLEYFVKCMLTALLECLIIGRVQ